MKVLFLTNIPSPYRVEFFREFAKECDLTVAFESGRAFNRDRQWKAETAGGFHAIYLKGIPVTAEQFFCPSVISLLKLTWDVIIIGVYSTPTSAMAIRYLKKNKIRFFIEADGGFVRKDNRILAAVKKNRISSASGWFSSGKATTRYLVHYGADEGRCYRFPFSSLKEEDIIRANLVADESGRPMESCNNQVLMDALGRGRGPWETKETEAFFSNRKEIRLRARKKLGIREEKALLMVGQFIYRKGIDVLLRASKHMDGKFGIYIVGGEPNAALKKLAEESPRAIHFAGFKNKRQLSDYYRAADIFVLPTREDIWGLVVNEAMSYGLAVITTDRCIAGIELVENGVNGWIVRSGHATELAKRLNDTVAQADAFGLNSLRKITDYTIEGMVRSHMEALHGFQREK